VPDTFAALQHNIGLCGAVVVTVFKRADGNKATKRTLDEVAKVPVSGYNPAIEAKGFTREQFEQVWSKTSKSTFALSDTPDKVDARF
jgi:sterol carrier protein 2